MAYQSPVGTRGALTGLEDWPRRSAGPSLADPFAWTCKMRVLLAVHMGGLKHQAHGAERAEASIQLSGVMEQPVSETGGLTS